MEDATQTTEKINFCFYADFLLIYCLLFRFFFLDSLFLFFLFLINMLVSELVLASPQGITPETKPVLLNEL